MEAGPVADGIEWHYDDLWLKDRIKGALLIAEEVEIDFYRFLDTFVDENSLSSMRRRFEKHMKTEMKKFQDDNPHFSAACYERALAEIDSYADVYIYAEAPVEVIFNQKERWDEALNGVACHLRCIRKRISKLCEIEFEKLTKEQPIIDRLKCLTTFDARKEVMVLFSSDLESAYINEALDVMRMREGDFSLPHDSIEKSEEDIRCIKTLGDFYKGVRKHRFSMLDLEPLKDEE